MISKSLLSTYSLISAFPAYSLTNKNYLWHINEPSLLSFSSLLSSSVWLNSAKCSLNANAAIFFSSFGPVSLGLIKISPPPSHLSQTFIKYDSNCHNAATDLASPETGSALPRYCWLNQVREVSLYLSVFAFKSISLLIFNFQWRIMKIWTTTTSGAYYIIVYLYWNIDCLLFGMDRRTPPVNMPCWIIFSITEW